MPIENERKFVLRDADSLEASLAQTKGLSRNMLRQAYLDAPGLRIRSLEQDGRFEHQFTYKRTIEGQVVEIETGLSAVDFARLWTQRRETLQKVRFSWTDGPFHWDVDFFKREDGTTYFAMAEVEMPEDDTDPPPVPPRLASHVIGMAPAGDPRFTSKRLADCEHAERLMDAILKSGRVE